ncbi:receptor-like protein EIX1 [Camellia sinensis]|uniref:receptor-like protein EIX1 n=1 Tax=Camellia sinensis TaxID=4442 RepID=UPI001035CDFE|nr:receptor-like protein EIX1 [Camellia sinensis]
MVVHGGGVAGSGVPTYDNDEFASPVKPITKLTVSQSQAHVRGGVLGVGVYGVSDIGDNSLAEEAEFDAVPTDPPEMLEMCPRFSDPFNRLSSLASENCCQWAGVICDNLTGHVHEIHLRNPYNENSIYKLGGKLNPSMLNLKHLHYLSQARFSRTIPHQLGNLTMLHYLGLGGIFNYGEQLHANDLQWLSGLLSLQHLEMRHVNLSNALDWLQVTTMLHSLVELHLASCELKYISPSTHINFPSLDLSGNIFVSSMPKWIFSMTRLVFLDISHCNFYGPIPSGLQNMTSLRVFDASCNNLNSSMPKELFNLNGLISLRLGYIFFQGPIPIGHLNMTSLRDLYLRRNGFESNIPNGLYSFSHLQSLDLEENLLQGVISSAIGNLTSLVSLDFSSNQLEGRIPTSMGQLCKLKGINLSFNKFDGEVGEVFRSFSRCKSDGLEMVHFENNYLFGQFPDELGQLKNLADLSLSSNSISGPIPISIGRLSSLTTLDISYNQLNGTLPENLGQLVKLDMLIISHNFLMGIVSDLHFANLTRLNMLYGDGNHLTLKSQGMLQELELANTGISNSIPTCSNSFKGLLPLISSNAIHLDLSNNSFSGSIYHALCGRVENSNTLSDLNLGSNNLSRRIPDCWKHWQPLKIVKLENNNLIGTIPHSIGHLASLKSLHLRHNKLSRELPQSLQHCTNLGLIDLDGNEFTGSIPTWMGDSFLQLMVLNLRSNKFEGGIPYELCPLSSLQILDLADNNLSRSMPKCFYNFRAMAEKHNSSSPISYDAISPAFLVTKGTELEYTKTLKLVTSMDLSENNLFGEIPKGLTRLVGLRSLNFSRNRFTGRIPENMGDMEELESLDFSLNQLSGEIPLCMSSLTFLSHLNLSYNNLIGRIPLSTQLQCFENASFVGNKLCGPPLANYDTNKAIPKVANGGNEQGGGISRRVVVKKCSKRLNALGGGGGGGGGGNLVMMLSCALSICKIVLVEKQYNWIMGQLKSLQLVASLTAERDGEIRKAALNTLATGYKIFGEFCSYQAVDFICYLVSWNTQGLEVLSGPRHGQKE